jgi:hypothetical protein
MNQPAQYAHRSEWHSARARVAKCLFCGAVGVWWACHCEWAQKIEAGKLPRPKAVVRNGALIIECCDELREAARAAGVIRMEPDRVDAPTSRVDVSVDGVGVSVDAVGGPADAASTETDDERLRRLKRERQARWREKRDA